MWHVESAERMLRELEEATDWKSTCHALVKFPARQVSLYASCLSASTHPHPHLLRLSLCYTVHLQVVKFADTRHGFTRPEKTREADAAAGQAFKYPHTLPPTSHLPHLHAHPSPEYLQQICIHIRTCDEVHGVSETRPHTLVRM